MMLLCMKLCCCCNFLCMGRYSDILLLLMCISFVFSSMLNGCVCNVLCVWFVMLVIEFFFEMSVCLC